jgi:hypothetical protein
MATTMKVFWNDCGRGLALDSPEEASLEQVQRISSDEVRGVEGNFIGLVDDAGRTIQFYFIAGIPDDVEDARHLPIVLMDFPQPERKGSYSATVTIGDMEKLIAKAFRDGADYRKFEQVQFTPW